MHVTYRRTRRSKEGGPGDRHSAGCEAELHAVLSPIDPANICPMQGSLGPSQRAGTAMPVVHLPTYGSVMVGNSGLHNLHFFKVLGIACNQPLESLRKCRDQQVCN